MKPTYRKSTDFLKPKGKTKDFTKLELKYLVIKLQQENQKLKKELDEGLTKDFFRKEAKKYHEENVRLRRALEEIDVHLMFIINTNNLKVVGNRAVIIKNIIYWVRKDETDKN